MAPPPKQIPPQGYSLLDCSRVPFTQLTGPLFINRDHPTPKFGLFVQPQHCDDQGHMDHGALATVADFAAGHSLVINSGYQLGCVTISLNLDFSGSAIIGDWLDISTRTLAHRDSLVYCQCEIFKQQQPLLLASAKFKTFAFANLH